MPDIVSGVRTSQTSVSGNKKPDIDSILRRLGPYQTPLFNHMYFSNRKSTKVINKNGKYTHYEDEFLPHQTAVVIAITASSSPATLVLSSLNVGSKAFFKLNDIVYIEDNDEQGYVTSITAGGGSDVEITAMDGTTSLTTVSNTGTYLKVIGNAQAEGGGKPTAMTTKEVAVDNYLTIFAETISSTGRDQAGEMYTDGTDHAEQVEKKMEEMKVYYERMFIYSKSSGSRSSSNKLTTWTKGMLGTISTNVQTYSSALGEAVWDDYLKDVLSKGTNRRSHLTGADQYNELNYIIKNRLGIVPKPVVTKYGVRLVRYIHGQGDISIIWDPVLDGKFTNWGITYDPKNVRGRHMANDRKGSRKFRIRHKLETPGLEQEDTKLLADIGIQIMHESTAGTLSKAA